MPLPVVDEARSADMDRRLSALGARLRLLRGSRPGDVAVRALFDELGELPLSVVEASANRLVGPAQANDLMRGSGRSWDCSPPAPRTARSPRRCSCQKAR